MTRDEIAKAAYASNYGEYPEGFMTMPEMLLFLQIRNIACAYREGDISKKRATDDKLTAFVDFASNIVDYKHGIEALQEKGEFYKRIELAVSAYRLDKTIENADKILEAIYEQ